MLKVAVGSTVVAYEDVGAGEPLVMIHGGFGSRSEYVDGFIPNLGAGIRALPYDQRDSGDTTNDDSPYTMSDLAADCAGFMDVLGLDQAHVIGLSYGGMIAMRLAIEHPERVHSLVLFSTSPGGVVGAADLAGVRASHLSEDDPNPDERLRPMLAEAFYSPGYLDEHPEEVERFARLFTPRPSGCMQRRLEAAYPHDCCDVIDRIAAPTLILHGSDDPLLSVKEAAWMAERIPDARLVEFEGMRHAAIIEQGERAALLVREFVLAHA